jgi:hypothetical protein
MEGAGICRLDVLTVLIYSMASTDDHMPNSSGSPVVARIELGFHPGVSNAPQRILWGRKAHHWIVYNPAMMCEESRRKRP